MHYVHSVSVLSSWKELWQVTVQNLELFMNLLFKNQNALYFWLLVLIDDNREVSQVYEYTYRYRYVNTLCVHVTHIHDYHILHTCCYGYRSSYTEKNGYSFAAF